MPLDLEDLKNQAAEMMKKVLTVGVGTLFLTEDALRTLVTELKLPKEMLTALLESANKTRREFFQNLSSDVMSKMQEKVDPSALLQEVLAKNDIELTMKIRFSPRKKDEGESSSSS